MNAPVLSSQTASLRALVNRLVFCLLFAGMTQWFLPPSLKAERHWTGAVNNRWSNPNNWDPVGVPQNDEHLIIDHNVHTLMVNDLVDLRTPWLEFGPFSYQLNGNALILSSSTSARLDVNRENTLEVNCPLIFRSQTEFSVHSGDIDRQQLYLNGPIMLEGVELFLEPTAVNV